MSRLRSLASPAVRRRRMGFVVALAVAIVGATIYALLVFTGGKPQPPPLSLPGEIVGPDPLAFDEARTPAYERAAAFGLSHVLFAKSPGGVVESARRTAAFRPMIEAAAARSDVDPNLLEAIVFLESAGRPNVVAGDDVRDAAGLTQILAETATNFLGMHVDLAASQRLTRRIGTARRRGDTDQLERLLAERRRVDARFDPTEALAATMRYLIEARGRFGRDDLAVVSYHMGIGNLTGVLRAFVGRAVDPINTVVDEDDLSYARLYFESSPVHQRAAWERLASFGDDSQTYYWRVLAAREIMRLFREDPAKLTRLAELHGRGPSAELVLQPPDLTRRFRERDDLQQARQTGVLGAMPERPGLPYGIDPRLGRFAAASGRDASLYRMLRPQARALLEYLAAWVRQLSDATRPLRVTGAVYDEAYASRLRPRKAALSQHAFVHATGYSFDIRRRYESGAQAEAFQYTLERLEALGLIAWMRSKDAIHITVSPRAAVRAVPARRS